MSKLVLSCENKEALIKLIDIAKEFVQEKRQDIRKSTNETIRVFYYKKEFWALLSKLPKRPLDTLYLKKGQKESLTGLVDDFFKKETRDIYLSFGMPYKCVIMLYGAPGTGKTTAITTTASHFDCDIYTIPITKELSDYAMIDAFAGINDKEDKKHIVVIEDIDSIFNAEERKKGDMEHNGITLQSFLNCLDGFTCVEGTMLFLTANKPEVLDYAMVRSCRIDNKIELGYADKYQTKQMFTKFFPDQIDKFKEFYDLIRHREFTTASLQEFLFYNRDCENILEIMDQFTEILEKNDPKNFEIVKDENKNFYS
jgi:SpoVK/Ycf46/Vps4 family AAA+-type ATPase